MNNKAVAALVAGALVIGLFVGLLIDRQENTSNGASGPGPRKVVAGVPVEYQHSRDGAAAAAAAYAKALRQTALLPADLRRRSVDLMSSREVAREVQEKAAAAWELIDEGLDLPAALQTVVLRSTPVGYRVRSYTGKSARIDVWGVDVVGKAGVVAPQADWGTTSFDLVWENDDWKLAGFPEQLEGPTPALQGEPTAASELVTSVRDLKEFSYVPSE